MRAFAAWFLSLVLAGCVSAEPGYRIQPITDKIKHPWAIGWLPSGDMVITARTGELYRLDASGQLHRISGVPDVHVNGQGGLLDIAVAEDGWIYLTYASATGDGQGSHTALMRARLDGHTLIEKQVLYKGEPNSDSGRHYGSRVVLAADDTLYFSIGDRGDRDSNPQDTGRDGGKIYRLARDGSVPLSNPFVNRGGAIDAIYSVGHRNPQGMAFHPVTGELWIHEHGPRGGDEINIIRAGANYGWPLLSYGINYNGTTFAEGTTRKGYVDPVHYWVPSIAPSGMAFVTSKRYPQWQGQLLVGSLKFAYVELCRLEGNNVVGTQKLFDGVGRVRDVKQGPDGYLYLAVEGKGVMRILPESVVENRGQS